MDDYGGFIINAAPYEKSRVILVICYLWPHPIGVGTASGQHNSYHGPPFQKSKEKKTMGYYLAECSYR